LRPLPVMSWRGILTGTVAAFLTAAPTALARCAAGPVEATVTYVRDGDTIEFGALAISLNGVAAPEWDTDHGQRATVAMRDMVLGKRLRCDLDGERTHDRCVGICYLGGEDIGERLIRDGLARDCPRYSGGRYAGAEEAAAVEGAAIRATYRMPGYCRVGG
jgi:micrococcal nuclease